MWKSRLYFRTEKSGITFYEDTVFKTGTQIVKSSINKALKVISKTEVLSSFFDKKPSSSTVIFLRRTGVAKVGKRDLKILRKFRVFQRPTAEGRFSFNDLCD